MRRGFEGRRDRSSGSGVGRGGGGRRRRRGRLRGRRRRGRRVGRGLEMKRNGEILRRDATILGLALRVCVSTGLAQKSKKGEDQANRSVQGTVTSAEDAPVTGAVVQLKNTKTLQIRSFITKED